MVMSQLVGDATDHSTLKQQLLLSRLREKTHDSMDKYMQTVGEESSAGGTLPLLGDTAEPPPPPPPPE